MAKRGDGRRRDDDPSASAPRKKKARKRRPRPRRAEPADDSSPDESGADDADADDTSVDDAGADNSTVDRASGGRSGADDHGPTRDGLPWALACLVVLIGITLVPSVAGRGAIRVHSWVAAAVVVALLVGLKAAGRSFAMVAAIKRPHYMQALTQLGVYLWWANSWAPVKSMALPILLQIAFAYLCEMLVAWSRDRPWRAGFGPLPITLSINLFLWFRDPHFGYQLLLIVLCYAGKDLIVWTRNGRKRHVFNPSSFGLGVMSAALLITGASGATFAREIAVTQEDARLMWEALFALGLIVQIQFPVVLVTMASAVTCFALGKLWFLYAGSYMFATTDIPAAVFLGMLLLITDPATSPEPRTGKVLFGVAYGVLVFALFPLLEDWGSYGYFDKLLPVPLLNLFVRRFDAVGERWGGALERKWGQALGWLSEGRMANVAQVGIWVAVFLVLRVSDAFGAGHPGRDITLWAEACANERPRACRSYFELLANGCKDGEAKACHNLAVELAERKRTAGGKGPDYFFQLACDGGLQVSCRAGSELAGTAPVADGLGDQPLARLCRGGDASACHNLGSAQQHGIGGTPDLSAAMAAYDAGCRLGMAQSCNSVAALAMQRGGDVEKARAAKAFQASCDAKDPAGCANLALMKLRGDGVAKDLEGAALLHRRACDAGLAMACARLADAHRDGIGVPEDAVQAAALSEQACKLGFQAACPP
jgi:TPR repeat protein